jgi:hypothetical protein
MEYFPYVGTSKDRHFPFIDEKIYRIYLTVAQHFTKFRESLPVYVSPILITVRVGRINKHTQ